MYAHYHVTCQFYFIYHSHFQILLLKLCGYQTSTNNQIKPYNGQHEIQVTNVTPLCLTYFPLPISGK